MSLAARSAAWAVVLWASVQPALAEHLWLVVGASDASATRLMGKAQPLAARAAASLVIQTRDCGDAKNVFAWVAEVADSAASARTALTNARLLVGDAYVKRCDALPGSLLALRIPAIDASIAMVPQDAVNWLDADRVSELRPLDQGRRLLITRRFDATPDDPLEGRRERLSLVAADGKRRVLLEHCLGPHRPMSRLGDLALQCVREQAGDAVLHSVHAFDAKGERLGEFERCRNPRWAEAPASQRVLVCDAESVGPDGQLKLQRSQRSLRTR